MLVRGSWKTVWLLVCCMVLAACAKPPRDLVIGGDIADLRRFPQDLRVYAAGAGMNTPLLDDVEQAAHWERYQRLFFAPWSKAARPGKASDVFEPLGSAGYAENLLSRDKNAMAAIVENANQAAYPNRHAKGITVRATNLRAAPTELPRFNNPLRAGEGYPFDMWQYSTLPAGMPVLMTHASKDGAWVFVENALVGGWVAEQDLAEVDDLFIIRYTQYPLLAVIRERTSLTLPSGRVVAQTDIGTLLAGTGSAKSDTAQILFPVRNSQGKAEGVLAEAPYDAVQRAPLRLTPGALAGVGNQILGQTYGWGGMYGHRDCSAMLRDVFTPFGVWLPRNSAAQAKAWAFTSLEGLSPEDKEERILREARPFATLLWLPGHITLYIGRYEGNAVMFHDMWGIRTDVGGREGRYVVGRALVSGVRPGVELPDVQDRNGLIARMRGMSTLPAMP